jgi:hypothetical protein
MKDNEMEWENGDILVNDGFTFTRKIIRRIEDLVFCLSSNGKVITVTKDKLYKDGWRAQKERQMEKKKHIDVPLHAVIDYVAKLLSVEPSMIRIVK